MLPSSSQLQSHVVEAATLLSRLQTHAVEDAPLSVQALFFVAWLTLRVQQPGVHRPFRVPGGTRVAVYLVVFPACVTLFTLGVNLLKRAVLVQFSGTLAIGLVAHGASALQRRNKDAPAEPDDAAMHYRPTPSMQ